LAIIERFAIDTRPVCVWTHDSKMMNRQFIEQIDPEYYSYFAKEHEEHLGTEQEDYAALSVRLCYGQALETLFAIISAAIQAPTCIYGWLSNYRNKELLDFVTKISEGKEVYSRFKEKKLGWQSLSEIIHSRLNMPDPNDKIEIIKLFGDLWERLADDFMNSSMTMEYNSIKHGFRIKQGGFKLNILPNGDDSHTGPTIAVEKDKYGTSSFGLEKIHGSKTNFYPNTLQQNWEPDYLISCINLISFSMHNIKAFLQLTFGYDDEITNYKFPLNYSQIRELLDHPVNISGGSHALIVEIEKEKLLSREEILSVYTTDESEEMNA